jgi:hypothetical protein
MTNDEHAPGRQLPGARIRTEGVSKVSELFGW